MGKALTAALGKLQKSYEESFREPNDAGVIKRIFLSSPQLSYLFGGGWPVGRIVQFHGPESSGKSTLSTYIAGEIQKQPDHNVVVYVDFERSWDKAHAECLGLDTSPDKFVFLRPENGEEAFTIVEELVRTGEIGLIIWDSDSTTPTRDVMANEYSKANFGSTAKLFSDGLKKFNPLLEKFSTSMIIISQERDNMNIMSRVDYKVTGGRAIKFYASNRSRITRTGFIKEKGEIVGIEMKVKNGKNKAGIPYREAELTMMFDTGFDTSKEYIDFLILLNIIEQKGAYFKYNDGTYEFNLQGRAKLQEWLDANPEAYSMFKTKVNVGLCETTEFDADTTEMYDKDGEMIEDSSAASPSAFDLAKQALEGSEE